MRNALPPVILIGLLLTTALAQGPPVQDIDRAKRELLPLRHQRMKSDAHGNVVSLDISEQDAATDDTLAAVKHLPHLQEFYAIYCPIRGAGLAHFVGLQKLEKLDLFATQVDDRALQFISQLRSLKYLDVMSCGVGPDGTVRQGPGEITDEGVALIAKLPNLETLCISGVITDQGLRSLAALTKLRSLEIDSKHITEEGIKSLRTAIPGIEIDR